MTQNPFEALGEGGFDMNALLEQAQQMQVKLEQAQQQLAATTVEGTVAGVTVKVSGTGELLGVEVKPGSFDGNDTEDLTDLGDMVVAAYREAKSQADAMASEALGPLAGGGLPGMPGMPEPGQPGQLGF